MKFRLTFWEPCVCLPSESSKYFRIPAFQKPEEYAYHGGMTIAHIFVRHYSSDKRQRSASSHIRIVSSYR